jgi:putative transposase
MAAKKKRLGTIWRIPDDLWEELVALLPPERPPGMVGRPQVPFRKVLNGILYVLRTGCQWKAAPKEFGSGSTCHKRFQEWERAGVFGKLWEKLLMRYDELRGIQWRFQSLDSVTVKAPLGGRRRVRTPRIGANPAPSGMS